MVKSFLTVLNSLLDEIGTPTFENWSGVYTSYSILRHFKGDLRKFAYFSIGRKMSVQALIPGSFVKH